MNATFSTYADASAAFASSPVRFRCLACGADHSSDEYDWCRCAWLIVHSESFYGLSGRWSGDLSELLLPEDVVLLERVPPLFLAGRRRRLDELRDLPLPERRVGSFPVLLSLTKEAFDATVSEARRRWWEGALSLFSSVSAFLRREFPGFPGPALPLPALVRSKRDWCLLFDAWALRPTYRGFDVVFYPGVFVEFWAVRDASGAMNRLLRAAGIKRVLVGGSPPFPGGEGIKAVHEDAHDLLQLL